MQCSAPLAAQPFSEANNSRTGYANGDITPTRECVALAQLQLRDVVRMTAEVMPADGAVPAFCQVNGTIAPEVTFQVNLPLEWNGRFYMIGNGAVRMAKTSCVSSCCPA